jgi:hypothetical protein
VTATVNYDKKAYETCRQQTEKVTRVLRKRGLQMSGRRKARRFKPRATFLEKKKSMT